jgi:hypothetical protein
MADCGAWTRTSRWLAAGLLVAALGCGDDDDSAADAGNSGSGGTPATDAGSDAGKGGSGGTLADASTPPPDSGHEQPDASTGHDAGQHDDEDAGGGGPSWSEEVHPALVAGCGGCHGEPSDNDGGGIVIGRPGGPGEGTGDAPGKFAVMDAHDAYEAILPFAVPGDPAHSNLYIKISQDMPSTGGQRMPPALRQWDDPDIQLVRDWIAAGAREN